MRLLTYQMPDELLAVASGGEFDEFDLNYFFEAYGTGKSAKFKHKDDVQKWLDIIRGGYLPQSAELLKLVNDHLSPIQIFACYRIYNIHFGLCTVLVHARLWLICWLNDIMCFGMTMLSLLLEPPQVLDWKLYHQCVMQ